MVDEQTRNYELMMIISPEANETEIDAASARVAGFIADRGGLIYEQSNWGLRRLAYPIQKFQEGNYVLTRFALGPGEIIELDSSLKASDDVMRHLTMKLDKSVKVEVPEPEPEPAEETSAEPVAELETAAEQPDEPVAEAVAELATQPEAEAAAEPAAQPEAEADRRTGRPARGGSRRRTGRPARCGSRRGSGNARRSRSRKAAASSRTPLSRQVCGMATIRGPGRRPYGRTA